MARTDRGSRSWFLAANGSIDGGMIHTRSAGNQAGTYARREKTQPHATVRCGRRNAHAASVTSFAVSAPM